MSVQCKSAYTELTSYKKMIRKGWKTKLYRMQRKTTAYQHTTSLKTFKRFINTRWNQWNFDNHIISTQRASIFFSNRPAFYCEINTPHLSWIHRNSSFSDCGQDILMPLFLHAVLNYIQLSIVDSLEKPDNLTDLNTCQSQWTYKTLIINTTRSISFKCF
jgi:hypothetical protein